MRPPSTLVVLLLGTGRWALATSSPSSLPSFLPPTHSGTTSFSTTSYRSSYSTDTPSSRSPHSSGSVSPPILPAPSLSVSTSALLTTTASSGSLLTQPGPSIIPTTPYIFIPFPSPSSEPPIPNVYPASLPKHPPPVEIPELVPDFALAWAEAHKKAKAKVGIPDGEMSFNSQR